SPGVKVTSAQTFQQDYWISVGGGGVSNCINETGDVCNSGFARPSWQSVTIPDLGSPQSTYRFVPDVSLLASPNFPGYIFCTPVENLSSTAPYDTETASSCANGIAAAADGVVSGNNLVVEPSVIGGTSASTPVFAGIVTLLNQYLGSGGLGNINPTLYGLASTPATAAFHSVKSGDNNVYCQGGQPSGNPADVICPSTGTSAGVIGFSASNADATTGYNLVTGLGSVDANVLAVAWKASLDPDFQLAVGALNPTSIPAGASTSTTVTISAIAGSTGVVVNFSPNSCTGLPSGATCSFNPASVTFDGTDSVTTQLTISTVANMTVPSSAQLITITPINSPNTTAQVSLDVTATNQTFSIASNAKTYSVVPGGTAQVQLTVAGTNGFVNSSNSTTALPVTYQCAQNSLPNQVQCSFSPTAGNAVSSSALTLNIATTGPTSRVQPPLGNGRLYYALLLPGLFGIVFASGSRSRAARLLSLIVVLGFSSVGLSSCGGSSGGVQKNTGTPPGTYAIVVNATTAGPNALTASLTVNLTVTQ
ncbi:MAG TPA: hypothetical protein VFF50_08665, partial [Candidatus Deferrimicrobiaceae bacterium]|nr:hypothetical protein [Candidatus Deferrimicrobiaceae bacterium]